MRPCTAPRSELQEFVIICTCVSKGRATGRLGFCPRAREWNVGRSRTWDLFDLPRKPAGRQR